MRIVIRIITAFLTFVLLVNSTVAQKSIFNDVSEGHYNFVAIDWLRTEGIVNGYMDGSFQPDKMVNRAEALKMIFNILGIDTSSEGKVTFPDVPVESWFYKYVLEGKNRGIISGYEDGFFRPERYINGAETLKIVFELMGGAKTEVTENPYEDVPKDAWFAPYALKAKERSVLDENLDGNVHLENYLTRADMAELIYRIQKSKEGFRFGKVTYYGGIFHGRGTAFGETFDENAMTAAHMTLPHNSIVRVTNLHNGESVEVRINDRGPFTKGRVLDLSKGAFEQIATTGEGYVHGQYEIISTP